MADAALLSHRDRLRDRVRLITIDLDATDDPTYGQQEFAPFNGPMPASPMPSCWPSSTQPRWSTCWGWPATSGWTSACGGCSAGRACRPGRPEPRPRCSRAWPGDGPNCSRFAANQLRPFFSVAAYVLFQALQTVARATELGAAQVWTLRERLVKVAVWVARSARRIVLHLPQAFPWRATWRELAQAVTAI